MHALDSGNGKALLHGTFATASESAKPRAREGWTTGLATPYRDLGESIREVMGLARHMTRGTPGPRSLYIDTDMMLPERR